MSSITYLPTDYQNFIALSRYARWMEDKNRRETWGETVARYFDFMERHLKKAHNYTLTKNLRDELEQAVLKTEVMPSMRALMTAGPALERDHIGSYNCSMIALDSPRSFDEMMYVLMCGTGVGFSVERQFVNKLPVVNEHFEKSATVIKVEDSKAGWCRAFRELVAMLYAGQIPSWDVSEVRPAGARLKTFGGRASGPEPLVDLFKFCVRVFQGAAGRKLTSLECHDIACKIGEVVVVGGVRRCLPGDAPVMTPTGSKPIREIRTGDEVVTAGTVSKVVAAAASGEKETVVIRHRFGTLECTPDHRVAVFDSMMTHIFKPASEIAEGDRLVWDSVGYDGAEAALPAFWKSGHFNAKDCEMPANLSADVAWLFGLIHGDGYISDRTIEISGNVQERSTLIRANEIFAARFGTNGEVTNDGKAGAGIRLRVNCKDIATWMAEHIKQPNAPLNVPKFVISSTKDMRFAYLGGLLDSDGRVTKKDKRIDVLTTIYKGFAEQIVTLLAGLGVAAVMSEGSAKKRRDAGVNAQDFWTVSIRGNTNRKVFCLGAGPHSLKLAKTPISVFGSPVDFSFPVRWGGTSQGYSANGNICVSAMRYDMPLLPTRVTKVEKGRIVETFDIQVENTERFTTNGIVVHNSALISLSNLSDDRMRKAKAGAWWEQNPQRALANNSAVYMDERPEMAVFMDEWKALYESRSGERGIFSRHASWKQVAKNGRRAFGYNKEGEPVTDWDCRDKVENYIEFGTNPCSEIILRSNGQMCNLTEAVVRPDDTPESLQRKVRLATILGTFQSTLTNFKYVRKKWKENCEEERLLGVSLTGICDHPLLSGKDGLGPLAGLLDGLRELAVATNADMAKAIGIEQSTAITCVKPSGTVSALVDSASGIHPRYSRHYVRRVRQDVKDPLTQLLKDQGVPWEPCVMKPADTVVFSFPMKSPDTSVLRDEMTAIEQLELWLTYLRHWCEHKPSITVYVREHEWMEVGAWCYKHFDELTGVSFLPYDNGSYRQAPYEEISQDEYDALKAKMPQALDWSAISKYEKMDSTTGTQELACTAGGCEIV